MYSFGTLIVLSLTSLLRLSSANVDCRMSCRRCREKNEYPELLEVYCAMCSECKERRREWVQGGPSISIRNYEEHTGQREHREQQDSDDCFPLCEDECETTPILLTGSPEETTVTTTTSTTTTTTTRRPCVPRPRCPRPCALPMIPLMPMCSMCNTNQMITAHDDSNSASAHYPTTGSMYLYLGLPKNLTNEIILEPN